MSLRKLVLLGSLAGALAIIGCGGSEPQSGVSKANKEYTEETKGAPEWVTGDLNKIVKAHPNYSKAFIAVGQDDIVGGVAGVEDATDQATMRARAKIASNLKAQLNKEVHAKVEREGKSFNKQSSTEIDQYVEKELVGTETLAKWVGKQTVSVLVGLDDDIVNKIRSEVGLESGKK